MSNAVPNIAGQVNGAGAVDALFLKVFGGEVITAFEEKQVSSLINTERTIQSGKSAAFPMLGKTTDSYHTPGEEIVGKSLNHAEQVTTIDDILYGDLFIDELDELKNHYEVRSHYASELGRTIAYRKDRNIINTALLAARASHPVTGLAGGSQITLAAPGDELDGDKLVEAGFAAVQALMEKDVPLDDFYYIVRPAQYNALVNSSKAVNRDFIASANGGIDDGKVHNIAGLKVITSNHLPSTNVTGTFGNKYDGDFSDTVGLVVHKQAVSTVMFGGVKAEVTYDPRRFGWLMTARCAVGHGVLNPQGAVEILKA